MEGVCVSMMGNNGVASKITATTRHQAIVVFPPPITAMILLSQEQAWGSFSEDSQENQARSLAVVCY